MNVLPRTTAENGSVGAALELRPLDQDDAGRLYELVDANRDQLAKFWWEQATQSSQDTGDFIRSVNDLEEQNGAPTRGVCVDETLIGVVALHTIDWKRRSSVMGYWIDKSSSGKGYVTAAARSLAAVAFDKLELDELQIVVADDNYGSRAVAEKVGFEFTGMRDHPLWKCDKDVYTATYRLLSSSWTRQHKLSIV